MEDFNEKIYNLKSKINNIKKIQLSRTKYINTGIYLLILVLNILIFKKINNIGLFNKYNNILMSIIKYFISFSSIVINSIVLYAIGDHINYKLYEKDEFIIQNLQKEINDYLYEKRKYENKEKINIKEITSTNNKRLYRVRKKD